MGTCLSRGHCVALHARRRSSTVPATAADIPPELYDLILDFFEVDKGRTKQQQRNRVHVNKRELGSCALVCRGWAGMCQKKIFRAIILRSGKDLAALLALISSSGSTVAANLEYLDLVQSSSCTPWIHSVARCVQKRIFPHIRTTSLTLAGADALFIHQKLPRMLPFTQLSQRIRALTLSNLQLENLDVLIRIPRELPFLLSLHLVGFTWESPTSEVPALESLSSLPPALRPQHFNSSTWNTPSSWLGLVPVCAYARLDPLETAVLCRVARSVPASADPASIDDTCCAGLSESLIGEW